MSLPPEYHAQRLAALPYQRSFEDHAARNKIVAVDFDDTISDNPKAWLHAMEALEKCGYSVVIVTWRPPDYYPEDLQFLVDKGYKVYYTSLQSKKDYMEFNGIDIAIWIDDNPFAILHDAHNRKIEGDPHVA
jgi:hypothetical protein